LQGFGWGFLPRPARAVWDFAKHHRHFAQKRFAHGLVYPTIFCVLRGCTPGAGFVIKKPGFLSYALLVGINKTLWLIIFKF